MDNFREFEGRNVDQAVFHAARELGRAPEDVEFEVLERGDGRVRIRVEVGAAGPTGSGAPATIPLRSEAAGRPEARRDRRGAPPPRQGRRPEPEPRSVTRDSEGEDFEATWSGTPLYQDLRQMAGALAAASGLDITIEVQQEPDCERLVLDGPDAALLTEENGEGLSALEHLLNKMALRGLGRRVKIRLDSAGYRRRREEEIVKMALESAERVKQEGGECCTSPLNPYERRLVHLALKEDSSVTTQSVGNGFLKKVTIRPAQRSGSPSE